MMNNDSLLGKGESRINTSVSWPPCPLCWLLRDSPYPYCPSSVICCSTYLFFFPSHLNVVKSKSEMRLIFFSSPVLENECSCVHEWFFSLAFCHRSSCPVLPFPPIQRWPHMDHCSFSGASRLCGRDHFHLPTCSTPPRDPAKSVCAQTTYCGWIFILTNKKPFSNCIKCNLYTHANTYACPMQDTIFNCIQAFFW